MLKQIAMLLVIAFLSAGFGSTGTAGNAQDETFKKELKAMAGTWRPIFIETDGKKVSEELLKEFSMTRDETGKVILRRRDMVLVEGTVKKIDASKKPKTMDTEETAGEQKGKIIQGIYEIDGDILRVCVALPGKAERPTKFAAEAGSGCKFLMFKREMK